MRFQDSEEKADVLDLEIQDFSSDTDDQSCIHITELRLSYPVRIFLVALQDHYQPVLPWIVSDLIYGTSIVCLDDLEEKEDMSSDQNSLDVSTVSTKPAIGYCTSSTEGLLERNDCRMLVPWQSSMEMRPKHVHQKIQEYDDVVAQLKDVKCSTLGEDHVAWDGSLDIIEELKQNFSPPRHMHPKLPEYDDVVAALKGIKAEIRQSLLLLSF